MPHPPTTIPPALLEELDALAAALGTAAKLFHESPTPEWVTAIATVAKARQAYLDVLADALSDAYGQGYRAGYAEGAAYYEDYRTHRYRP